MKDREKLQFIRGKLLVHFLDEGLEKFLLLEKLLELFLGLETADELVRFDLPHEHLQRRTIFYKPALIL